MRVLVTGAEGLLGQEVCKIFTFNGHRVISCGHPAMDVTSEENVSRVLSEDKPSLVIHCAAYTNVDGAEKDPSEALRVNEKGTKNVALWCAKNAVPLVYISTDYVFDGKKDAEYLPDDKTNPINKYGESKLKGEMVIKSLCDKYYILRTSWLYGAGGRNFVKEMIKAKNSAELRVINDQIGSPSYVKDVALAILKIVDNNPYGTYHVNNSGSTSWYGLAEKIFSILDVKVNLKPVSSDAIPRPAKRPAHSVMNNGGICRPWEEALSDFLNEYKV